MCSSSTQLNLVRGGAHSGYAAATRARPRLVPTLPDIDTRWKAWNMTGRFLSSNGFA
jgi:hypothetical protein